MNRKFIKEVEKMIDPVSVGTLHFMHNYFKLLPISTQNKIIEKTSKDKSFMGFIVEPYSYFLCYELNDIEKAKELLPDGFELLKTKIFDQGEEKYYFIICAFNVKSSGFIGSRTEAYLIARNKENNLMSWIIVDYLTNTISYDNKNAMTSPNSKNMVIATNYKGELIVDIKEGANIEFNSDITKGEFNELNKELWIDGNLSISYSKKLSNKTERFSLKFIPEEMDKALKINKEDIDIIKNDWYKDLIQEEVDELVCFPYAQHFISDSPGFYSNLKNEEELRENIENIDFESIKSYSNSNFKKIIILIPIILLILILFLIF